jgi:hypothetical protein
MFLPCLVVLVFLFLNFAIAEGVFETLATAELPAVWPEELQHPIHTPSEYTADRSNPK